MKILALLTLLLIPVPGFADSIQYTFSTTGGVNGSFTLDAAPFVSAGPTFFHYADGFAPTPTFSYYSTAPLISGTYGEYSFLGTGNCCAISPLFVGLSILDYQPPYDSALDQARGDWWIERANVSSQMLNGRSITAILIFEILYLDSLSGPTFIPPSPPMRDLGHFSIDVRYSDGTVESRALASLTMVQSEPVLFTSLATVASVPEMPTLVLLPFGLIGLMVAKRRVHA